MPIIGFGGGFGGGGGTSYINGVVPTSADLPTTVGSPPTDSVYLAKVGSGVWLINRKPAGLYVRVADNGVAADWTYLGAFPEVNADGNWELYNTADPTKELKFSLSGITTGNTRTLTVPDASGRIQVEGQPIGNTTPSTGAFTTLTANNGTLTASAPVLDLAQTWNASGTAFTALALALTNTASASASSYFNINLDGVEAFSIRRGESSVSATLIRCGGSGLRWTARTRTGGGVGLNLEHTLGIGSSLEFLSTASGTTGGDVALVRDGDGVLGQRRGANAQTFNIYNTFTSATNHERGFLKWSSNVFLIGTEKGSAGGTARAMEFQTDGVTRGSIGATGDVEFLRNVTLASGVPNGSITMIGGRIILQSDASGILRLHTGTVAQDTKFVARRITSGAGLNFEQAVFGWTGTEILLSAEAGGTGTLRGIKLGSASTSLLGFFGATPVVCPSSTGLGTSGFTSGGGGNTVHATSTFTGNVGSTAYTLSDIVAHLKNLGLIAV
jgi:hypothetical protein